MPALSASMKIIARVATSAMLCGARRFIACSTTFAEAAKHSSCQNGSEKANF
jgi:hypothetical protein